MKTTLTFLVSISLASASAAPDSHLEATRVITAPAEGWEYFFGSCSWYCGAPMIKVTASSSLTERSNLQHPASQAHDRSMKRVWSEGVEGTGIGESLTFTFLTTEKDTTDLGVTSCAIAIGHQASKKDFRQNSRPKVIELRIDGVPKAIFRLNDTMGLQQFAIPKLPLERPSKHTMTLKIIDVYRGTKFEDTCIAEVYFQGTGKMH